MTSRDGYLALCVIGTVLPLSQLAPFVSDSGWDAELFVDLMFANPVGGFFGLDVVVSSVVLWLFVFVEGRRLRMRRLWAPITANLLVGVSLGLPLFLYLREARLEMEAA